MQKKSKGGLISKLIECLHSPYMIVVAVACAVAVVMYLVVADLKEGTEHLYSGYNSIPYD